MNDEERFQGLHPRPALDSFLKERHAPLEGFSWKVGALHSKTPLQMRAKDRQNRVGRRAHRGKMDAGGEIRS